MSYILDALKKAEAERNTGTAPGPLPAQAAVPAAFAQAPVKRPAWTWLALALAAGVAVGVAWLRPMAQPPATAVSAPPPASVAAAASAQKPAEPAQQEARAEIRPEAPQETQPEAPAPEKKPPRKAAPKKDGAAPAPASASVATLNDLPDAIRREIPALKIGGYIYSANKADRSVLINNRLLREGDEAAPGLVLERMQPNGMVLTYKGYQYRMNY